MFKRSRAYITTFKGKVVIALVIISLGCSAGIWQNHKFVQRLDTEQAERRDQSCNIAEREHKRNVDQLKNTYRYLNTLNKEEARIQINQYIIRTLPRVEETARVDVAPKFCDAPNVGLPEPDPKLPKHKDFRYLLKNG